MEKAYAAGEGLGITPILTGILPTIRKSDLGLENMTPNPALLRAQQRADATCAARPTRSRIKGVDELMVQHDSVMVEACNASFQAHLQVGAAEFAKMYNIAQAVTGPVLAAVDELAAALRQAPVARDAHRRLPAGGRHARLALASMRERSPRVDFGRGWVKRSVLELYREDVARFRVLLAAEGVTDPFEALARGEVPDLKALRLHNGTIYRWNRACYGISTGSPTCASSCGCCPRARRVVDEIANAALWWGLMQGLAAEVERRHDADVVRRREAELPLGRAPRARARSSSGSTARRSRPRRCSATS